jgi:zinc transport system substrate-binding protein
VLLAAPFSACAQGSSDGTPQVVASFYPLQYVAQRVVGEHADVVGLTSPGVEPHDLELKPRQVASLSQATAVLVETGLQPAVDDAIRNDRPEHLVDAAKVVDLRRGAGGTDPHFWLDPTLLAEVGVAVGKEMAAADPAHAADYRSGASALTRDLTTLDGEVRAGLAACRTRDLVVSHDAFEYFGRRYGLEVHAIAGLSPDAEPSAKHLAELGDLAREKGVTTVFNETLASPRLADTLASDLGLRTAVLDPVEGLTASDRGDDYLSLMRRNLAALREACR